MAMMIYVILLVHELKITMRSSGVGDVYQSTHGLYFSSIPIIASINAESRTSGFWSSI